jgi:hypothetical protein
MEASFVVLMYRYCLFGMSSDQPTTGPSLYLQTPSPQVIVIVSSAIVCSAAAWNLPISQNASFHGKIALYPTKLRSPLICNRSSVAY